ncbi:MAG: tetratricopeptide repeat protein [Sideroxydans sp.]|nr:tetratricopeptide repeat protein [Sideroxydans sp.]
MKQLTSAICLCFALAPAMAADEPTAPPPPTSPATPAATVPVAPDPAASGAAAASPAQPVAPVEAPVIHIPPAPAVVECAPAAPVAPPAAPAETAASKMRAAQQNLALPKVELLRTTIKNTTPSKNLFSRFLSSSSKPIDVDLLADMRNFTERFPDFPETAEVFHLMAVVHQRTDNNPAAAIDWLMLRAAYPASPFSQEAAKQLKKLADDDLKKHADTLKAMGAQIDKLTGERDERMAAMLAYLRGNTQKDFAAPIADACASFLVSNQSWMQEDVIEHALARQAMLLDPQVALYHLNKMLALYPSSPLRPDSMLSIGNVQHDNLNAFDQAAKSYSKLIEQYPDSAEAKQGYELLGATYDTDLQDYPNALKTYQAIVARYKDDPVVLRALRAMANIQQSKTRQPADAIASYLKIADIFKGADGLQALLAAERLAMFTTEDWKAAMDINNRIMALAPQDEEAIKAQFNNADITENKLNDKEAARTLYVAFASKYPNHALTRDANRRIESLNKALSPSK